MKIAIAKDGNMVSSHFGHCEGFEIINVENNNVKERNFIPNPGHMPRFLPNYLNDLGVNVVISGGMGASAVQLFNKYGIKVIIGASGIIDDVIWKYLSNQLKPSGNICNEHMHTEECGK